MRLIGDDGEQFGVVSLSEARRIGDDRGLDIIEVSPNAKPPVCKLMDYGKYKYRQQKQKSEAKKKQVKVDVKEIKFRPNIDVHDLDVKMKKAAQFLGQGDKIKLLMQFRGREMAHKHIGKEKFQSIIDRILEMGAVVESQQKMMGNRIIAMVGPSKKAPKKAAAPKPEKAEAVQK